MKFKIFYSGCNDTGWRERIEEAVNKWLGQNPHITILQHQIGWSPGGTITMTFVYA